VLAIGYSLAYAKSAMDSNEDVVMEDNWQFYDNYAKKLGEWRLIFQISQEICKVQTLKYYFPTEFLL